MDIIQKAKSLLRNHEIMLLYVGGSHLYGLADEDSDYDINVIVKNRIGYHHTFIDNIDFFIYSNEDFRKLLLFDKSSQLYSMAHTDVYLNIEKGIVYINPEYKEDLSFMYEFDLKKNYYKFLANFVEYYYYILKNSRVQFSKRLYQIHRIKAQIENYKRTGSLSFDLLPKQKERILHYKKNFESLNKDYYLELDKDMNYIIEYYKEGENNGLG